MQCDFLRINFSFNNHMLISRFRSVSDFHIMVNIAIVLNKGTVHFETLDYESVPL
jgi:hypothetical protein